MYGIRFCCDFGAMKESKGTTHVGFVNRNGQVFPETAGSPGPTSEQRSISSAAVFAALCTEPTALTFIERKCPDDGGRPGLPFPSDKH
jgi:hypothetical protein